MLLYNNGTTVNYEDAKGACKAQGQTLARIQNENDWNDLVSYEDSTAEYGYWWLGAEKQSGSDHYRWNDGKIFSKFSRNMKVHTDDLGNRCLAMYTVRSKQAKILSMPCDQHLYFICETRVVEASGQAVQDNDNFFNGTFSLSETLATIITDTPDKYQNNPRSTASQKEMNFNRTPTEKEVFSPTTESDLDPVVWMFVSLTLALLLVVAVIAIAKLWTDVKKLRNRLRLSTSSIGNGRYHATKPASHEPSRKEYYPACDETGFTTTIGEEI